MYVTADYVRCEGLCQRGGRAGGSVQQWFDTTVPVTLHFALCKALSLCQLVCQVTCTSNWGRAANNLEKRLCRGA